MNTPVEHRPASSGTTAPPAGREDPVPGETGRSGLPAVPAQPSWRGVPAERRGRTEISDQVVSRIAAHAAGEVPRVREVGEWKPLFFRGGTHATLDADLATLQIDVTVEYPAPIREVAEEVRRHVAERVMTLTGKDVGHIDVNVTGVAPARGDRETSRVPDAVPAGENPRERSPERSPENLENPESPQEPPLERSAENPENPARDTGQAAAGPSGGNATPVDDPVDDPTSDTEDIVPLREER
ncbi:Asp23/Gls24 family envelope stress response protein [Streptosporangium sp. NPDC049078]|uniref:Asp23/Gls24 family envelope stress response protein n=1 Tax=Streptosporangium sp. NPDC049078 TaxID=3155767 RepID=UPI00342B9501